MSMIAFDCIFRIQNTHLSNRIHLNSTIVIYAIEFSWSSPSPLLLLLLSSLFGWLRHELRAMKSFVFENNGNKVGNFEKLSWFQCGGDDTMTFTETEIHLNHAKRTCFSMCCNLNGHTKCHGVKIFVFAVGWWISVTHYVQIHFHSHTSLSRSSHFLQFMFLVLMFFCSWFQCLISALIHKHVPSLNFTKSVVQII